MWTKLESSFFGHPKFISLSDGAVRLWVQGLCWSVEHLTDGRVKASELHAILPSSTPKSRLARACELEEAGLWNIVDGGWQIHDFTDYQPTKSQVEAERARARRRMARIRSGGSSGEQPTERGENNGRSSESRPTDRPTEGDDEEHHHPGEPSANARAHAENALKEKRARGEFVVDPRAFKAKVAKSYDEDAERAQAERRRKILSGARSKGRSLASCAPDEARELIESEFGGDVEAIEAAIADYAAAHTLERASA